jgi:hypothetical protein
MTAVAEQVAPPRPLWRDEPQADVDPAPDGWPTLHPDALHGLAGDVVRTLGPHTESDPVALLVTFLTVVGAMVPVGADPRHAPHAVADAALHPARLATVVTGITSRARKGTSFENVRGVIQEVTGGADFLKDGVVDGFGSGEALVDTATERVENLDGRVLVYEPEFARLLNVCSRDGSTLSSVVRHAWDGRTLAVRSRNKTSKAEGASVAVLGHITVSELRTSLTGTDAANGFANRFMFVLARRARLLPHGGEPDMPAIKRLAARVDDVLKKADGRGRIKRTAEADRVWEAMYRCMAADDPGGLVGAVTARAEAQVLRLSVVYAVLDASEVIDEDHLKAAWAVWRYARHSAQVIFGGSTGDNIAEKVLAFIRAAGPKGATGTEIHRHLGNNYTAERRAVVLAQLEDADLVVTRVVPPEGGKGRPATRTTAQPHAVDAGSPLPTFPALVRRPPPPAASSRSGGLK